MKPGIVFSSFITTSPSEARTKKSARAMPSHEVATNAATASSRARSICASSSPGGGITSSEPPSSYFDDQSYQSA